MLLNGGMEIDDTNVLDSDEEKNVCSFNIHSLSIVIVILLHFYVELLLHSLMLAE
jgi:hypothetical protein